MSWLRIPTGRYDVPPPPEGAPPQQWLDFAALVSLVSLSLTPGDSPASLVHWIDEVSDAYMERWSARPQIDYDPMRVTYTHTISGEKL